MRREQEAGAPSSRIDELIPVADVSSQHCIVIAAHRTRVWSALISTDLGAHWLVRLLMFLRAIPAFAFAPVGTWRRWRRAAPSTETHSLRSVLRSAFTVIAEEPERELVLGITGQFWKPDGGLAPTDAARFAQGPAPGFAQGALSFRLEDAGPEGTRLVTETRVRCADDDARRAFRRYWNVVAGGSGLLRLVMLNQVRRAAEA